MRPVPVLIATTTILAPASAVALTAVTAASGQTVPNPLTLRINPRRVDFGHPVNVTGDATPTDAGRAVVLESAPSAGGQWRQLAATRIGRRGRFRIRLVPRSSSVVRAVEAPGTGATATVASVGGSVPGGAAAAASPVTPVKVAARFAVRPREFAVLGSGGIRVAGQLLPAASGRPVRLQSHGPAGWRTVARSQTGRRGRFSLRYAPGSGTGRRLRVLFGGDGQNERATGTAGTVSVFSPDLASWYNDAGTTACGYHAGLGVANRTLPCGTRVAFHFGGRTVTAVVDDRGPYVGGRNWDLNENTAAALGFAGVGTVWVSQ
jgi:hypothetical protein